MDLNISKDFRKHTSSEEFQSSNIIVLRLTKEDPSPGLFSFKIGEPEIRILSDVNGLISLDSFLEPTLHFSVVSGPFKAY